MRVYIVSSDNDFTYDKFIKHIQYKIGNVSSLKYEEFKLSLVNKMFSYSLFKRKNDLKLVDNICNLADKHSDFIFVKLTKYIEDNNFSKSLIFININDVRMINKLKRFIKRPKYITVRLYDPNEYINGNKVNIDKLNKQKWDSKITYINSTKLNSDTDRFILKHVNTFKFIYN